MSLITEGWKRRQKITIDNTKVAGTAAFTNFSLAILASNLNPNIFSKASSSGGDIRFSSDPEGGTEIPREVVFWNNSGSAGQLTTKIPTLEATIDTNIYVWYGNGTASDYASTATYGRNNVFGTAYGAVHHMTGTAVGDLVDSSGNGVDMDTTSGTPTFNVSGDFGSAVAFNANSHVRKDSYNFPGGLVTWTGVYNVGTVADSGCPISVNRGAGGGFAYYGAGNPGYWSINTSYGPSSGNLSTGRNIVHGIQNGGTAIVYLNGVAKGTATGAAIGSASSCDYIIGDLLASGLLKLKGNVSESWYKRSAESANFVTTEYNMFSANSSFFSTSLSLIETLSDSLTLTDSVEYDLVPPPVVEEELTDTLSLSDSLDYNLLLLLDKSLSDTLTLSDDVQSVLSAYKNLTDFTILTDFLSYELSVLREKELSDEVTLSDVLDYVLSVLVEKDTVDTITITDSVDYDILLAVEGVVTDSLAITDSVEYQLLLTYDKQVTDSLTLTDSVTYQMLYTFDKEITDTLTLADSIETTRTLVIEKDLTDTLTLQDGIEKSGSFLLERELSDGITISDAIARIIEKPRYLSDMLSLTDSVTYTVTLGQNVGRHYIKVSVQDYKPSVVSVDDFKPSLYNIEEV